MMYWDSSWAWLWMTMMMVIFWGAVAAVVIVAFLRRPDRHNGGGADARDILDARFARGEIDAEEYEQRRRILDGTAHPTGSR